MDNHNPTDTNETQLTAINNQEQFNQNLQDTQYEHNQLRENNNQTEDDSDSSENSFVQNNLTKILTTS
jgi:hypothetical protein